MARSYLFVPADQPRKIEKALAGDADAIILDLEDSVAPDRKDEALRVVIQVLESGPYAREIWVRLNATDELRALQELAALPLARIKGVVRPKLTAHEEIVRLGHQLDALEARDGLPNGSVAVFGIVTETARAVVDGGSLGRGHPRLAGYTWGVEDLSADIGRPPIPGQTGAAAALARHAQMFCLLAASAARIPAIDAVSPDFKDLDALRAECRFAAELGFVGKAAIHPAQIAPIHGSFTPDEATREWARKVVAAVAANPTAFAFQVDGRMVDRPHVAVAEAILRRSGD